MRKLITAFLGFPFFIAGFVYEWANTWWCAGRDAGMDIQTEFFK